MSRATPTSRPEPHAAEERLHTAQAFSRFVARVTPYAGRWLARWGVPAADRDDVLQETLLCAYRRRESYEPALGRHVDWAYGFLGRVVRNYRKVRGRRVKRIDVAAVDLPDVAVDGPSPEEETDQAMRRRLLETCLAGLDRDSAAILLARDVDEIPMVNIAAAHGISLSTAYAHYQNARAELQRALDREQSRERALGVAVLPLSLDRLLASEREPADIGAETMRRIWKKLDRAMAADKAAGRLGDDGTEVVRYMGVADEGRRVGPMARALRALLDPRVSHVLTGILSAAGGAFVTYQIMKGPAERRPDSAVEVRTLGSESSAPPAPPDAVTSARSPRPSGAPELQPDAGAPERPDAGPAVGAMVRDDIAEEQALFDKGSTAYQEDDYEGAIEAFRAHAGKHPRGRFASQRERLWTLALIRAGRTAEARERIERLRRASPGSPLLEGFDEALGPKDWPLPR